MVSIREAMDLDALSSGNSVIHNLEGRIKLISLIFLIVFTVSSTKIIVPLIVEIFLLMLIYLSKISFKNSFKRILFLLPFGGLIILFQPFIHSGNIIWVSPISWIHITDIGLNWGILLFARLIVSLTAIVILSSTSPLQEITESFRKLKMPKEIAMILSIMIRFLFLFIDELQSIRNAQSSRSFDIFNKITPYKWRVKQVGYTIAMVFLKSYEKGEIVYNSMLSRGFSDSSKLYNRKAKFGKSDYLYIISIILLIVLIEIIILKYTNQLGFF
jgi:cobalt/nickel transport system permease protein